MNTRILLITLSTVLFFSCKKEDDTPDNITGKTIGEGVIVLNEGAFLGNNSSVTFYSESGEISDNLFQTVNDRPVGDVLQSVMETQEAYYLVVNNSSKIEVVGKKDFKSLATIEGFRSPRYMKDMGNGKALVTNFILDTSLTEIEIDVVNLSTNKIENNIPVNNTCEMMELVGQTVYVANTGQHQILAIDINSLEISSTIKTAPQPHSMVKDKNGFLWVLCSGDFAGIGPSLAKIDVEGKKVEMNLEFPAGIFPSRIAINQGGGTLYILADKVYKMSVGSANLALSAIPNTDNSSYLYALGIDPETEDIYIGDAKNFASSGQVHILNKDGVLLSSFDAGIAPNGFIFR